MYKIILILIMTICFSSFLLAQTTAIRNDTDNTTGQQFAPSEEVDNPDEAGVGMPNIEILEEKQILDVVEGVGHIPYNMIPFLATPSPKSRVVRYSTNAEKVILIGEIGDYYKVIMYNNKEAYIQKKYVKTTKFFMDETTATNSINKTISIKLEDLLDKFNSTLEHSSYVKKNQTRPVFELVNTVNARDHVTLVFHYACTDLSGRPIPSYNDNHLYEYMQQLLDLILGRLLLTDIERFNIIIKIPTYDESGRVIDFDRDYANIILSTNKVNIEKIRKKNVSILSLTESNVPVKDLFKAFPK